MPIQLIGMANKNALVARKIAAGFPPYLSSVISASVNNPDLLHMPAKTYIKKMLEIPKLHHSQFPATPRLATMPHIYKGVSIENVVAARLDRQANVLRCRLLFTPPVVVGRNRDQLLLAARLLPEHVPVRETQPVERQPRRRLFQLAR